MWVCIGRFGKDQMISVSLWSLVMMGLCFCIGLKFISILCCHGVYVHIYTYIYTHTHIYIYMYIYIYTCIYIC